MEINRENVPRDEDGRPLYYPCGGCGKYTEEQGCAIILGCVVYCSEKCVRDHSERDLVLAAERLARRAEQHTVTVRRSHEREASGILECHNCGVRPTGPVHRLCEDNSMLLCACFGWSRDGDTWTCVKCSREASDVG